MSGGDSWRKTGIGSLCSGIIVLFPPLFLFRKVGPLDFWWWLSLTIILLVVWGSFPTARWWHSLKQESSSPELRNRMIAMGVLSALALYLVFLFGNWFSRWLFSFAEHGISSVYAFRGEAAPLRIILLLAFVIGPGEEILWRGLMQDRFSTRLGSWRGMILTSLLYTCVHVASGNLMLVIAAMVCGFFWGFLYLRYHSLILNMVSHSLWDLAVFVFLPLQ